MEFRVNLKLGRKDKMTDIRPRHVRIANKVLEAICGLSSLVVVGGMLDSIYPQYVNLTSGDYILLATTAITSGFLSIQSSRLIWNDESFDEYVDRLRARHKK